MDTESHGLLLVEDDNEDYCYFVEMALITSGFTGHLDMVPDVEGVKKHLLEKPIPELIIIDHREWHEMVIFLRGDERYRRIPVMILRAIYTSDDIEICDMYGCYYDQRPIDIDQWKACMANALRLARDHWTLKNSP